MNPVVLRERALLNRQVRVFFAERNVLEVETPALSQAGNTDPCIDSFSVNTPDGLRWLHTSPEYPMKRLLADGSGDIYQLTKVWRQGERGRRHNPEFTLLEWYRVGFTYRQLMQEVADLLHTLIPRLQKPPQFRAYRDLFLETLHIDPHVAEVNALSACAHQHGINIDTALDAQGWCDLLMTHCIEPQLPTDCLSFVYHYPAAQSALSKVIENNGLPVAERFEVYLGELELGNGYQEQTEPLRNRQILQADADKRGHDIPVDEHFLAALEQGLPECAGVALGVDRILMSRMQVNDIKQVIAFPWEVA